MDDWDLVVVGGGPAGSTAALSALRSKPGARVLILDAAAFPRDKVCGDGIAPHALDILRDLDVDTDALTVGTDSIIRLQLRSPGGATVVRPFARPAYVVPRLLFDDRLMQCAITAGATLHRHRVRTVVTTPGGVVIDDKIRAHTVIGADGAESVVRRHTAARCSIARGRAGHPARSPPAAVDRTSQRRTRTRAADRRCSVVDQSVDRRRDLLGCGSS